MKCYTCTLPHTVQTVAFGLPGNEVSSKSVILLHILHHSLRPPFILRRRNVRVPRLRRPFKVRRLLDFMYINKIFFFKKCKYLKKKDSIYSFPTSIPFRTTENVWSGERNFLTTASIYKEWIYVKIQRWYGKNNGRE